jgi:hypothetical protein
LLTTRPEHVGLHGLDGRWSRKYDCCVECGRTTRPHAANGHCDPCYVRLRGRRLGAKPRSSKLDSRPSQA